MHDGLSWACSKVKSGGYDRNDIDQTNPAIWGTNRAKLMIATFGIWRRVTGRDNVIG
jgi:hypothetical protein